MINHAAKSRLFDNIPQLRDDADYLSQFEKLYCENNRLTRDVKIAERELRTILPKIYTNSKSAFYLLNLSRQTGFMNLEKQFKSDPKTFGHLKLLTKLRWYLLNLMKYESKPLRNAYEHMCKWRMLCEELRSKRAALDALGGPYK